MVHSSFAHIHEGAMVALTARLGDYVVAYSGAEVQERAEVLGYTQLWGGVSVGNDVVIESGVTIGRPRGEKPRTTFEDGCKVGAGAVIADGVRIGLGAVICPGSLVESDVPAYAKVSGSPARVVGYVGNASSSRALASSMDMAPEEGPLDVAGVLVRKLKKVCDPRGDLSVGNFSEEIPFKPSRYFLVFNVPSEKIRGEHAHHACEQFLICVHGSCAVVVDDGRTRSEVILDSADVGIYLPPMTWGVQYKYSHDAVLLVFASHLYDPDDYIRDYNEFLKIARGSEV